MSSSSQVLPPDPADAFAFLYDTAPRDPFRNPTRIERWRRDTHFGSLRNAVREAVWWGSPLAPFVDGLVHSSDPERGHVAIVVGIDDAFSDIHPGRPVPGRLPKHVARYHAEARFSTDATAGAVVPRFVRPGAEPVGPASLDALLDALFRIPPDPWAAHRLQRLDLSFDAGELTTGPLVACAPMIGHLDELDCAVIEHDGYRSYRIRPAAPAALLNRLPDVLDGLDRSGAVIGLLPELTLSPLTLEGWRTLLAKTPRPAESRLRIIVLGTGHLEASTPPPNRAVVVDRDSGSILATQDKTYGFTLEAVHLKQWNLKQCLGSERIDEDMLAGKGLCFLETDAGRLLVLICQDLSKPFALGSHVAAFGPSCILTPVFSKPMRAQRWEHKHALDYASQVGSVVAVANSLAVGSPSGGVHLGASLTVTPRAFSLGCAAYATDVVAFEPHDDEVLVTDPIRHRNPVWGGRAASCP